MDTSSAATIQVTDGVPPPKRRRLAQPVAPPRTIADMAQEILLRLPPGEPGCLARAALVCKRWRRLVSDRAFLRRYRAFHRTPPMLGFVLNLKQHFRGMAELVPTAPSFRPETACYEGLNVLDARHGRVLLRTSELGSRQDLVVWDPITDDEWEIPRLLVYALGFNAAVLCAAAGCDHLDCRGGPFLVALVGSSERGITFAYTYSSEAGAWGQRIVIEEPAFVDEQRPSVLVGNTVYCSCDPQINFKIVGYDVAAQKLSMIWPPSQHDEYCSCAIMKAGDGTLGLAGVQVDSFFWEDNTSARLYLWSMKAGPDGFAEWTQRRVIRHKTLLRTRGLSTPPQIVGFADGHDLIFVRTGNKVLSMDLKSDHVRQVYACRSRNYDVTIIPYMSFYTPDHATGSTAITMRARCHPVA
ncbi:uncharacterized protein LOC100839777 [Brachypodium distachyon]|uniref:Uncharacterized protein n=1 Tax=Brachypodium distachyon TaxID=15368 RepID=A0A2K2DRM2_BRADI|nr:uncharacterized protein LOC100839777 [Brachypodium distachyon]PNT76931.1 hypothetical protein BRADI_1g55814v3 [Brachypodium distachyon]PNT76932.1 hypothetical protein BRADI_1g55814v3 [Brachypodium distachyon]|eukprot:XP_003561365.1 uncharacterized protein LOC100839777 [Brachypodium distachyon]